MPLLIVFFAGGLLSTLWYLIVNGGERTVKNGGITTTEPVLSDSAGALLATGATVSMIGLVFSVVVFLFSRRR